MNFTPPVPVHPTHVRISLGAFRHNLSCVRAYCAPSVKVMAIVKANAYGHGVLELSAEAVRAGVAYLAVARVEEALEIRKAGIAHPVLVFENPPDESIETALAQQIELTISTAHAAESISRVASRMARTATVHLKVDTGMGRLGLPLHTAPGEIERAVRLPRLSLGSVYTHLATSEEGDLSYAREQLARFSNVLEELRLRKIEVPCRHIANSGAVMALPESHLDMVRPGILLYGYTPAEGMAEPHPVRPVMSLLSCISMIKEVEAGTSISYGRRFTARKRTVIATVPIGYADGYSRLLTNRGSALICGRRYPVAGAVSMDHIMIDLGSDPPCEVGDTVTLIGRDGEQVISAWDVAKLCGTIPYEVTCLVSTRLERDFVE